MRSVPTPEQSLVYLARLRSAIWRLCSDKKLEIADYQRLVSQLDTATNEKVSQLDPLALDQLLAETSRFEVLLDQQPIRVIQEAERTRIWLAKHRAAHQAGQTDIEVGELFEQDPDARFPLHAFDWSAHLRRLNALLALLDQPTPCLDAVREAAVAFFSALPPIPFATGSHRPDPTASSALLDTLDLSRHERNHLQARLGRKAIPAPPATFTTIAMGEATSESLWCEGDAGWKRLHDRCSQPGIANDARLAGLVLGWRGPGQARLILDWMKHQKWNGPARAWLCARLGMDPKVASNQIEYRLNAAARDDRMGRMAFGSAWKRSALPLILLQELAARETREQQAPIRLLLEQWIRTQRPASAANTDPATSPPEAIAVPKSEKNEPDAAMGRQAESEVIGEALGVDQDEGMDLEDLSAPVRRQEIDDHVVETTSTWNLYLKPFLSENWLGLIGAISLTAAWLFLSMWLWEKGVTFRVLAGTVPIAVFALGSAWVTSFFERREVHGTSPRATALLASLTFLSVPFYLLLTTSLTLSVAGNSMLGLGLGVAFLTTMSFIGKRISGPFGFAPHLYLFAASSLLLLPGLTARFAPSLLDMALQMLPLALGAVVFAGVKHAERVAPERFTYTWMIHVGHALLSSTLAMIFFRVGPKPAMFTLLLPAIAVAISFFPRRNATAVIAAGALGVLGNLLALPLDPTWLTSSLLLSGFAWYRWSTQSDHWAAREITTLHMWLIALATGRTLHLDPPDWVLLLPPAFVLANAWERHQDRGPIQLTTWGLVFLPIPLALVGALQDDLFHLIVVPATIVAILAWGHVRLHRTGQSKLWLVQQILVPLLLVSLLAGKLSPEVLGAWYPLVAVLPLAAWMLWGRLDRATFVRDHRATLQTLWLIPATAAAIWATQWAPATPKVATFTALALCGSIALLSGLRIGRRAQSPLQALLGLAAFGCTVEWVRSGLGFPEYGGLPAALAAVLLLALALRAKTHDFWALREPVDSFLSRSFPWRSPQWLPLTLRCAAGVTTLLAAGRAIFSSDILTLPAGLPHLAALVVVTGTALWAAIEEERPVFAWTAFVPMAFTVGVVAWWTPSTWKAHVVMLMLALFQCGAAWTARRRERFQGSLAPVWSAASPLVSMMAVSLGFLVIPFLWPVGALPSIGFMALLILFADRFPTKDHPGPFAHATFIATFLLWLRLYTEGFGTPASFDVFETTAFVFYAVAGFASLWWLTGPIGSRTPAPWKARYQTAMGFWRPVPALVATMLLLAEPFLAQETRLPVWSSAWVWLLLCPAVKPTFNAVFRFLRAFVACNLGVRWTGDLLSGLTIGLWLFVASEYLLERARRILRGDSAEETKSHPESDRHMEKVLYALLPLIPVAHLALWGVSQLENAHSAHTLSAPFLYALLPLVFFSAFRIQKKRLFGLGLFWFAYANFFTVVELAGRQWIPGLSLSHALAAALLFTLAVFGVAGYLCSQKEFRP